MVKILLFLLLVTKSILSCAAETEVQWSSFGTLGLTLSDSNKLGYRTMIDTDQAVFNGDIDFKTNSLLGGQVDLSINKKLDFFGQVVLQEKYQAKASDYVTMAFVRYSPSPKLSFRLGRIMPDLFKITEYRNINVAYTWANVPTEVYGMMPFYYLDGGDVAYTTRVGSGVVDYKFSIGRSSSTIYSELLDEEFDLSNMYSFSIGYDKFDWNLQAKYTSATFANNGHASELLTQGIAQIPEQLWPNRLEFAQAIGLKDTRAKYYSVSGQKEWQNWLFSFELGRIDGESLAVEAVNNGYVSAAYILNADTFYGLYAQTAADNYTFDETPNGQFFPELVQGIESLINFYSSNQKTYTLGWRRDINTNITSKLQINVTNIDENGSTLWLNSSGDHSARTVTSMLFTLSFAL